MTSQEQVNRAMQLHQSGQLAQAEQAYVQILNADPGCADAWHLWGLLHYQRRQYDPAIDYIRRALALKPQEALFHCNLGEVFRAQSRFAESETAFRDALRWQPRLASALNNLGTLLGQQGRHVEGLGYFEQALAAQPDFIDAVANRALALFSMGRADEAIAACRQAIQRRIEHAPLYNCLGLALASQSAWDEALEAYSQALRLQPNYAEAYNNRGTALLERGDTAAAEQSYRTALRLDPRRVEAYKNLGALLRAENQAAEAADCFRKAIELRPDSVEAQTSLGNALNDLRQNEEALRQFARALELDASHADAFNGRGIALRSLERWDESAEAFETAFRLKPTSALAINNLSDHYWLQGDLDRAINCCRRAIEVKPDYTQAHCHLAYLQLALGDYEHGWAEHEWRLRLKSIPPRAFPQLRWDGSPLGGRTILLYDEQGFGDSLQFVRFAALVKRHGGRVIVECHEPLARILSMCAGIDEVIARGQPLPRFDVQAPLLSVPAILRLTERDLATDGPYLVAPPDLAERWRQRLSDPGCKVGLVWQGRPAHPNDRYRSLRLADLAPLAEVPDVRFYSLQKGDAREQLRPLADRFPITDLADELHDFADTAAVLANLDLLVSCDSSPVHLAGALGVQVWVAIPSAPDWRWLVGRTESPWYPTLRLFRQTQLGRWAAPVEQMQVELRQFVAAKREALKP